jgi:tRNA dimethylallyltransferase
MAQGPTASPVRAPVFLAGATATGKSDVALELARRLGGEIVSVDSMQVYRGMDIGTAKPSPGARGVIPHHLLDVVDVSEAFDAARFVSLARAAVAEIRGRGRVPIFCGGTGLYFKAYLEGLGEAPPGDPVLRAQLEATPLPELLRELAERDAVTHEKIDRQNPRRVIRAIEVIRLTGKPFSAQRAEWKSAPPAGAQATPGVIGLERAPEDLKRRIAARVDEMFRRGLVQETERLLPLGLAQNRTASQALGYRQVMEHLAGGLTLPETIELVKIRTRQFAKRQLTWFRRQLPMTWVALEPGARPQAAADRVCQIVHET